MKAVREEDVPETPLLDLFDAAVTAVIRSAKKRGYITHDQVNTLLSRGRSSPSRSRNLTKFSDMGINVVETADAELGEEVANWGGTRGGS